MTGSSTHALPCLRQLPARWTRELVRMDEKSKVEPAIAPRRTWRPHGHGTVVNSFYWMPRY